MATGNEKLRGAISGSGSVSGKASPTIYYTDAYNIAVAHGFRGTIDEWLESLKGEPGAVQTVNGFAPDENGNVEIKIPEGGGTVTDEQIAESVAKHLPKMISAFENDSNYATQEYVMGIALQAWDDVQEAHYTKEQTDALIQTKVESYVDEAILGGAW